MKKVYISSGRSEGELELARMLELELTERNCEVTKDGEDGYFVHILVYDYCSYGLIRDDWEKAETLGVPMICCSRENDGTLPFGTVYVERPLDVPVFCDYVVSLGSEDPDRSRKISADIGGGIMIDRKKKSVFCRGEEISLTEMEYCLLCYLDENRGRAVSREEAYSEVWHREADSRSNIVDVIIRYLRKKIDERFDSRFIVTVRGKGYMLK